MKSSMGQNYRNLKKRIGAISDFSNRIIALRMRPLKKKEEEQLLSTVFNDSTRLDFELIVSRMVNE
jgi:hypothetical protein